MQVFLNVSFIDNTLFTVQYYLTNILSILDQNNRSYKTEIRQIYDYVSKSEY